MYTIRSWSSCIVSKLFLDSVLNLEGPPYFLSLEKLSFFFSFPSRHGPWMTMWSLCQLGWLGDSWTIAARHQSSSPGHASQYWRWPSLIKRFFVLSCDTQPLCLHLWCLAISLHSLMRDVSCTLLDQCTASLACTWVSLFTQHQPLFEEAVLNETPAGIRLTSFGRLCCWSCCFSDEQSRIFERNLGAAAGSKA